MLSSRSHGYMCIYIYIIHLVCIYVYKQYVSLSLPLSLDLQQMLRAVRYMQCHDIVHRDLKPEHFMFTLPLQGSYDHMQAFSRQFSIIYAAIYVSTSVFFVNLFRFIQVHDIQTHYRYTVPRIQVQTPKNQVQTQQNKNKMTSSDYKTH